MSANIVQRLEIDAGHRLMGHEGKCRNAHGHRYVFEVECSAVDLDHLGRVIDFSVVKQVLGGWLDAHWDHGFLYQEGDPLGTFLLRDGQKCEALPAPPTAENIAMRFLAKARDLMSDYGITVVEVVLWETLNCRAKAR